MGDKTGGGVGREWKGKGKRMDKTVSRILKLQCWQPYRRTNAFSSTRMGYLPCLYFPSLNMRMKTLKIKLAVCLQRTSEKATQKLCKHGRLTARQSSSK